MRAVQAFLIGGPLPQLESLVRVALWPCGWWGAAPCLVALSHTSTHPTAGCAAPRLAARSPSCATSARWWWWRRAAACAP